MRKYVYIETRDGKSRWRIDYNDLNGSFKKNWQVNSNYEISFTLTYSEDYKDVFNCAKEKLRVWYDNQGYDVQQRETKTDEQGMQTAQLTCTSSLIDLMKNIRLDKAEPTEDHPETSDDGASSNDDNSDNNNGGTTVKKTAEQQTVTLDSCLHKFLDHNDQHVTFQLHGTFIQAAVDVSGSLYEWLNSNLKLFGAYWLPDMDVNHIIVQIYDLASLQHKTGKQFRYLYNTTNADVQIDATDLVNDCEVYGGKMEKDFSGAGGGGNLDNVEGFCKSSINADFGVNKGAMLSNFAARSQRVHAWGVDVNRLYDTVKSAGVSPEWFFAYELQEQLSGGLGWLNHTYRHGDPYSDAISVCDWIKSCSNSASINPAWSAPEGSMTPNPALQAKWNQEFGKGSIGRVYLQGTAAAVWDLAGVTPNPAIGKPITGCVNTIRGWGSHTVVGGAGASKWIQVAKSFVGIPYVWGGGHSGNNPRAGMDCSGLGEQIAKACGFDIGGGNTVSLESASTPISRQQVQTGDMGFYGSPGNSYHVVWALDNNTYIAEPDFGKTCYIGQINSYPANFWKRHPKIAQFVGTGTSAGDVGGGSGSGSETYYALHFHYTDQESVKKYGLHRGAPVVVDSIYDMNALKEYVQNNVQHDPQTSLTISSMQEMPNIGDVWRLTVPEFDNMNVDVTVMGINGNDPDFNGSPEIEVTLNNTALAMKNINAAMLGMIRSINKPLNIIESHNISHTSSRQEDHLAGMTMYSKADMQKIKAFTEGGS